MHILYRDKLEITLHYDAPEDVERSRRFDFLDEFRNEDYPDDMLVLTLKEGLNPEGCWVRLTGLGDKCFIGTLLNEPNQDFGYHMGEEIAFFIFTDDEGNMFPWEHLFSL